MNKNCSYVLAFDGWLKFNEYKWGLKPLRVRLTENDREELPFVEAVFYLDKKGRIVQPPLNPYLPVIFHSTPTNKKPRLYRQWVNLSRLLVEEFKKLGMRGTVAFPPEIVDIRQWQWNGFLGEVRYTFYIELPLNIEDVDNKVRTYIKKAEKSGFTWEIATQKVYKEVIECLLETEHRQNFQFRLTTRDLEVAKELLGEEIFRVYLCRDKSGEVASARIILSFPGLRAIGWVAGTKRKFLSEGAAQFLILNSLIDLSRQGIKGFDFCGANLPNVSAMKANWGGSLTPYYAVSPLNFRSLIRLSLKYLKQIV